MGSYVLFDHVLTYEEIFGFLKGALPFAMSALLYLVKNMGYRFWNPRKDKEQIEFDFIANFLTSPLSTKDHFVVERAFSRLFKKPLAYSEIIQICSFQNRTRAFKCLIGAAGNVEIDAHGKFQFTKHMSTNFRRKAWQVLFGIFYVGFFFVGMSPLIFILNAPDTTTNNLLTASLWTTICVAFSMFALKTFGGITDAERLIKYQATDPIKLKR
jgi:hypothetical protein